MGTIVEMTCRMRSSPPEPLRVTATRYEDALLVPPAAPLDLFAQMAERGARVADLQAGGLVSRGARGPQRRAGWRGARTRR